MQDIDTTKAAAGDSVLCELGTEIRQGRKVILPSGAQVVARIVGLKNTFGLSVTKTSTSLQPKSGCFDGA